MSRGKERCESQQAELIKVTRCYTVLVSHLCCTPDTAPCGPAPAAHPDTGGETSHSIYLRRAPSLHRLSRRTGGKKGNQISTCGGSWRDLTDSGGSDLPGRQTPSYVLPSSYHPGCRWASLDVLHSQRPAAQTGNDQFRAEPINGGFPGGAQAKAGSPRSPQDRDTGTTSFSLPWRLRPGSPHPVSSSSCALVSLHLDHLRKAPLASKQSSSSSTGCKLFTTDMMSYQ